MPVSIPEPDPRLTRLHAGDEHALAELFAEHHPRLLRMVEMRLDADLRRRLDPADIVQEAWLEVTRRYPSWRVDSNPPFPIWLRLTTSQALAQAQRRHLGTRARDARLEAAAPPSRASISAANVAELFVASATSPSQAFRREELRARVLTALGELDELDREIVALRHFEGLSNDDAAAELAITPAAASKRFLRALLRLKPALELHAGEAGSGA